MGCVHADPQTWRNHDRPSTARSHHAAGTVQLLGNRVPAAQLLAPSEAEIVGAANSLPLQIEERGLVIPARPPPGQWQFPGRRRGVDPGMRNDREEFMNARPGYHPRRAAFCQYGQPIISKDVPGRILAMCINENVGVKGYHAPRPL